MERFDFFMNSDCSMIKINMNEVRFVYLQKSTKLFCCRLYVYSLLIILVSFCSLKLGEYFKSRLNVNEKVVIRPSTVLFFPAPQLSWPFPWSVF